MHRVTQPTWTHHHILLQIQIHTHLCLCFSSLSGVSSVLHQLLAALQRAFVAFWPNSSNVLFGATSQQCSVLLKGFWKEEEWSLLVIILPGSGKEALFWCCFSKTKTQLTTTTSLPLCGLCGYYSCILAFKTSHHTGTNSRGDQSRPLCTLTHTVRVLS